MSVDMGMKSFGRGVFVSFVIGAAAVLAACGASGVGTQDASTGITSAPPPSPSPSPSPSPTPSPTANFTAVTASWTANADNPDGYLVYIGPSATTVNTLAKTLSKGGTDWNPNSPSADIDAATVLAAVGSTSQVCVEVRAFNGGGVSTPSQAGCVALP